MSGLNQVTIVGRLGSDPDIKVWNDGSKQATCSIATSEQWKDKTTGELKESTEWHRVVLRGRSAEIAENYLRKGSWACIQGKLKTRTYEKEGATHYTTEIISFNLALVGSKHDNEGEPRQPQRQEPAQQAKSISTDPSKAGSVDFDDDLPF